MQKKHAKKLKAVAEIAILLAVDVLSLLAIFELSLVIRIHVLPLVYADFPSDPPFRNTANLWWLLLAWVFFFWYKSLYTKRLSVLHEIEELMKVAFFATACIFAIISVGKMSEEISRTLIVIMGLLSMVLLPGVRIMARRLLGRTGLFTRRVLILGATESGRLVARALRKERNYGYQVVAFLDDKAGRVGETIDGVKVYGGTAGIATYIQHFGITDLFVALAPDERDRLKGVMATLNSSIDRLLFVPDFFGVVVPESALIHCFHEQVFAFEIRNDLSRPFNMVAKRLFDIAASATVLAFLAIPMCVIGLLIRLESAGPALFFQQRIGKKGKLFRCYKFRTMHADAEERLAALLAADPAAKREWEAHWKLKDDPRVTRLGRLLRSTSLDELPQLINVLKGEMSIVGPRPVVQAEIEKYYKEMADVCFSVAPGITGLWQVSGRTETGYDSRIGFDSWYVNNWNIWMDITIALRTVTAVLKREGAY